MVAEAPTAAAPTSFAPAAVTGKININTATSSQLESLTGIGPKKAQIIIAGRPYTSIKEITKVKGTGPKTYEKLQDFITISGAAAPAAAPTVAPAVTPTAAPAAPAEPVYKKVATDGDGVPDTYVLYQPTPAAPAAAAAPTVAPAITPPLSPQQSSSAIQKGTEFMPRVDMALETGRYFHNWPGYAWRFRRRINIDIWRFENKVLFFKYEDENILGSRTASEDDPQKIRHEFVYLGLRQEWEKYSLSYSYTHISNNRVDRTIGDIKHWDTVEAKWETKGMRLGYKNEGIDFDPQKEFELLKKFHGMAALGVVTAKEAARYYVIGQGGIRYDILRYRNKIPYFLTKLYTTVDPKLKPNLTVET
ncbi:MAG TPA: ComEA family DNA-binding protein, partial [bacterium]|nr:ComEA family DNA-binding protein [bacterium]